MGVAVKGLWNVVLSGYPRSGKSMLARRIVVDIPSFARIGVDELREMLFNEGYPCRDEFLIYSMIAEMRDDILRNGYSTVIDATSPNNVTRQFLLTTNIKPVNRLLIILSVDKEILIKRNIEKFGDAHTVFAYDKRWEEPKGDMPIFKFKSNNIKEFEAYYARLMELLESETHPFKPEFHRVPLPIREMRKALENFLKKR